jgi:hypothetical protein
MLTWLEVANSSYYVAGKVLMKFAVSQFYVNLSIF